MNGGVNVDDENRNVARSNCVAVGVILAIEAVKVHNAMRRKKRGVCAQ